MTKDLETFFSKNNRLRKALAIATTLTIAGLLTWWGIYGIGEYGIYLFVLVPFLIGALPIIIYGSRKDPETSAFGLAFLTLLIFLFGLMFLAIEGLLCILMATPPGIFFAWIGSHFGSLIANKSRPHSGPTIFLLVLLIPFVAFIEKEQEPRLRSITSSIIIDAKPSTVWKNVIEFPQLPEPEEILFKAGISYPINARIEGHGVGAIRYCNFNTGNFVEPITVWNENQLLKFDVTQQPAPLTELSFWDINAPHLHDYFISKGGQFKLSPLPDGRTLLGGTTWYTLGIKPGLYWNLWGRYIINSIHNRVLRNIKKVSEDKLPNLPD